MNILAVCTQYGLFKPKSGGQNRFYNLINQLAKNHNTVIVLHPSMYKSNINNNIENIKVYCFNQLQFLNKSLTIFTDFNFSLFKEIIKILKNDDVDLIQFSGPWGIIIAKLITKTIQKKVPIVYDAHNVEYDMIRSMFASNNKYSYLEKLIATNYVYFQEKIAVSYVSHILVVSQKDKRRFMEIYDVSDNKLTVIPSGVNIPKQIKNKEEVRKKLGLDSDKVLILFHGSYFHHPNKEAIKLITDYIAPRLIEFSKDIQIIIAGTGVPVFKKNNYVKSIGFVDDIYSLINAVDIAIAPIKSGAGTKLKILDYMAVGIPLITTKKGIEGIEAENGKHALIVDDVNEDFIEALKYLIFNERERKRIGKNARELVKEKYDWKKIGKKLNKLYKYIVEINK